MGAGAGGSSAASRENLSRDGRVEACNAAKSSDTDAPENCGALVRVEVVPLSSSAEPSAEADAPAAPAPQRAALGGPAVAHVQPTYTTYSTPVFTLSPESTSVAFNRTGIAVVSGQGSTMRILGQCKATGSYAFSGGTMMQTDRTVQTLDELHTTLPFGGSRFEQALARNGAIFVALTIVGAFSTNSHPGVGDLTGTCAGATHFVARFDVGAATVSSQSESLVVVGNRRACGSTPPDMNAPPTGCSAPLQILAVPLASP
jgi:hypothetical protein